MTNKSIVCAIGDGHVETLKGMCLCQDDVKPIAGEIRAQLKYESEHVFLQIVRCWLGAKYCFCVRCECSQMLVSIIRVWEDEDVYCFDATWFEKLEGQKLVMGKAEIEREFYKLYPAIRRKIIWWFEGWWDAE